MTANEVTAETADEKSATPGNRDPLLASLVKGINQLPGMEFGVTLNVAGLIVSGIICAASVYFAEVAKMIRENGSAESAQHRESMADLFDWVAEEIQPAAPPEPDADDDHVIDLPEFIHMRAVRMFPDSQSELPELLWRGRLADVSGWSIGNFGRA